MGKAALWLIGGVVALAMLGGGGYAVYSLAQDAKIRERSLKFKPHLDALNTKYGLPPGLLYWMAYKESRYRDDIISGATRSGVGAAGMFQFMPGTAAELKINPLDWQQAADGAARYMTQLYRRYKSWPMALAAYNAGMGNMDKRLKDEGSIAGAIRVSKPETQDYVAVITQGMGIANPAALTA